MSKSLRSSEIEELNDPMWYGRRIIVVDDGDRVPPLHTALSPVTSNRGLADQEAIRAAKLRRERKVAKQAKGFRDQ